MKNKVKSLLQINSELALTHCRSPLLISWLTNHGYKLSFGGANYKLNKTEDFLTYIKNTCNLCELDFMNMFEMAIYTNDQMAVYVEAMGQFSVFIKESTPQKVVHEWLKGCEQLVHCGSDGEIEVSYYFLRQGSVTSSTIFLEKKEQAIIYPELYPSIDIVQLNKAFFESREKLLILYGIPGVGKTTFLRYMLVNGLYKNIAYVKDMSVVKESALWGSISTGQYDLIIFDDLDNALQPRKANKDDGFVNNLLSYADGVLNKSCKVVITTNQEIEAIDAALLRPGRCFDFITLPPLNREEAKDVWINILQCDEDAFEEKFRDEQLITQALIMSEYYALQSSKLNRSYNKTDEQYCSVAEKIRKMGINTGGEVSGFRRSHGH